MNATEALDLLEAIMAADIGDIHDRAFQNWMWIRKTRYCHAKLADAILAMAVHLSLKEPR